MTRDDNVVLNAQQARKMEKQYHIKQVKKAQKQNPYKTGDIAHLRKWYKIAMSSKKKRGMQPWMEKNIKAYQKAIDVENKIKQQRIARERWYDSGLNETVKNRAKVMAHYDAGDLQNSRVYRTEEQAYQKAPVEAIKILHKQQQDYNDHREDNHYRIMTGLAQVMCNEGLYTQTQLLAVKDTIRTRYLIKHNYPQAHTDVQMLRHANISNNVLYQHRKVYQGQNVSPSEVIDNPMYQKLLKFENKYKGGIKRDLQRINQATSSTDLQVGESKQYVQEAGDQVRNEAQYALKDDPVIHKAQRWINKVNPTHHKLQQITKGQWDVKAGAVGKQMAIITDKIYPHQPYLNSKTNRSIYNAQLAKFHQNPHYKDYLTPQASRVINTYKEGIKEHKIKQPSFNHAKLAKQIQPRDKKTIANQVLDTINMYKPSIKRNYYNYKDKLSNWARNKTYDVKEKIYNHKTNSVSYQEATRRLRHQKNQGLQR